MGWAALGGFEAILVDNGGPYRSRLETMATLMIGGAIACVVGTLVGDRLWIGMLVTAVFCFAATFARVASERIASTSVIILVLYFAGFGASSHTAMYGLHSALQFVLGGAWAALLSLLLWPVDPFRPARLNVAACYKLLSDFTGAMLSKEHDLGPAGSHGGGRTSKFQRDMRRQIEAARRALGTTPARVTARTVRARNLSVLLETADMLFATTMRWREMAEIHDAPAALAALQEDARWLSGAEKAIWSGLQERPGDHAASYLPEGSHSMEHVHSRAAPQAARASRPAHLAADERDALENIQIAFEAVRALWTGVELWPGEADEARAERYVRVEDAAVPESATAGRPYIAWMDAIRANWTRNSVMMRHALRMGVVGGADILLMRLTHVRHGSWLAMTSIIVLQPYGSGTLRRGLQRVGGTIAGGVLAAVLATAIHDQNGLIATITVVSGLTLATYAVDYAWYCFFLTPTFVLMSMPYLRDWRFAEVRMANTVLGALVAVAAMRLLWPEREHIELRRLLGQGAAANANYLAALLQFWPVSGIERAVAERQFLAPVRRLSGLAINEAEESLDRMMLEPGFGRRAEEGSFRADALIFVTYLRRLTRAATALAVVGTDRGNHAARLTVMTERLRSVSGALRDRTALESAANVQTTPVREEAGPSSVEEQQLRRLERQVGVLERTAESLLAARES